MYTTFRYGNLNASYNLEDLVDNGKTVDVYWFHTFQDGNKWRVLMKAVLNILVL
jgi:hypothetical protein